jgi:hypothetical protein
MTDCNDNGARNFDFILGEWTIHNRRLRRRWAGSEDWDAFPATAAAVPVLDGTGNIDHFRAPERGILGLSLRLYDRDAQRWSIWWVNARDNRLQPPVHGCFSGGIGEFFGDDVDEGRPIRVRYRWTLKGANSARWEQAFSDDGGATWETNWIMEHSRAAAATDAPSSMPVTSAPAVVELRRYRLHPGRRNELIALFEREFIESQEAVGMHVLGQFREPAMPDRFVWLRGFAGMTQRHEALAAFYGGPVWHANRSAANATMIDVSDVLLLRPVHGEHWPRPNPVRRPPPAAPEREAGLVVIEIHSLTEPADAALLARFADAVLPLRQRHGAEILGLLETEPAANTFAALPVRTDRSVVVALYAFPDAEAWATHRRALAHDPDWAVLERELTARSGAPRETMILVPTRRSAMRHSAPHD